MRIMHQDLYLFPCKIPDFTTLDRCQGLNEGGSMPRAPKNPSNVASTFFIAVHLLPEDLRFEHGGAKLLLGLGAI